MTVLPAADAPIPIFTTLQELYGSLMIAAKHAGRWNELVTEFETKFGCKPTYIARAPGRVNLIGTTSHSRYNVNAMLAHVTQLPIEHDILIACAPRSAVHHFRVF
ncbi:hypothetical protein DFH29DRAFT_874943 [Suillus ampliporus]|nr:hypothetical protein DFH29DRAFT_874943 [Suillus ampliporus]